MPHLHVEAWWHCAVTGFDAPFVTLEGTGEVMILSPKVSLTNFRVAFDGYRGGRGDGNNSFAFRGVLDGYIHGGSLNPSLGGQLNQVATPSAAALGAEGYSSKVSLILDTRPTPMMFGMAVEILFEAGCVDGKIKFAGGNKKCAAGQPPADFYGELNADCGDTIKLKFKGIATGTYVCVGEEGEQDATRYYNATLRVPRMQITHEDGVEVLVTDVTLLLDNATGGWELSAEGKVKLSSMERTSGVSLPRSVTVDSFVAVEATVAADDKPTVSSVVTGTFAYTSPVADQVDPPAITAAGHFMYTYPCPLGEAAHVNATVNLMLGGVGLPGVLLDGKMFCGVGLDEEATVFTATASFDELIIKGYTITDVDMALNAHHQIDEEEEEEKEETAAVTWSSLRKKRRSKTSKSSPNFIKALFLKFSGYFKGSIDNGNGRKIDVVFTFDTRTRSISIALTLTYETDALFIQVMGLFGVNDGCDVIKGNSVQGRLEMKPSIDDAGGDAPKATLVGVKHCEGHAETMEERGHETDPKIEARIDPKLLPDLDPDLEAASGFFHVLEAARPAAGTPTAFPEYRLEASVEDMEFVPGLTLDSASMTMWSRAAEYGVDIADQSWAGVLTGKARAAAVAEMFPADLEVSAEAYVSVMVEPNGQTAAFGAVIKVSASMTVPGVALTGTVTLAPAALVVNRKAKRVVRASAETITARATVAGGNSTVVPEVDAPVVVCCNANSRNSGMSPMKVGECCDPEELTVVSGKQCVTSRWCAGSSVVSCAAAVSDIAATTTCDLDREKASPPPPPPYPPPVDPDPPPDPNQVDPLEGCCNANNVVSMYEQIIPSGDNTCCDRATLRIKTGAQCTTSRWCKSGAGGGGSCATAINAIAKLKTCVDVVAETPDAPMPPSVARAPPPPARAIVDPPPSLPEGCCNGHPDFAGVVSPDLLSRSRGKCCDKGTLMIVDGEQCTTSKWCKGGSPHCVDVINKKSRPKSFVSKSTTCADVVDAPMPSSVARASPPPVRSIVNPPPPTMPEGCCNGHPDFAGRMPADLLRNSLGKCCDKETLMIVDGEQCTTSKWCKGGSPHCVDVINKKSRPKSFISKSTTCADVVDSSRRRALLASTSTSSSSSSASLAAEEEDAGTRLLCPEGSFIPFEGTIAIGADAGVGAQFVAFDGRYFCVPEGDDSVIAELNAELQGQTEGDSFLTLRDLTLNLTVVKPATGMGVKGRVSGSVPAELLPDGFEAEAVVMFDTVEKTLEVEAKLSYASGPLQFDFEASGTFGVCRGEQDAVRLAGSGSYVTSNFEVTGEVSGVRYCEPDASTIYGHTYQVSVSTDMASWEFSGGKLVVWDLNAEFFGVQRTKTGSISWSGEVSALTSYVTDVGEAVEPKGLSGLDVGTINVLADVKANIVKNKLVSTGIKIEANLTNENFDLGIETNKFKLPPQPGGRIKATGFVTLKNLSDFISFDDLEATVVYYVPKTSEHSAETKTTKLALSMMMEAKGTNVEILGKEFAKMHIKAQLYEKTETKNQVASSYLPKSASLGRKGAMKSGAKSGASTPAASANPPKDVPAAVNSPGSIKKVPERTADDVYETKTWAMKGFMKLITAEGDETKLMFDNTRSGSTVAAYQKLVYDAFTLHLEGSFTSGACAEEGNFASVKLELHNEDKTTFDGKVIKYCEYMRDDHLVWDLSASVESWNPVVKGVAINLTSVTVGLTMSTTPSAAVDASFAALRASNPDMNMYEIAWEYKKLLDKQKVGGVDQASALLGFGLGEAGVNGETGGAPKLKKEFFFEAVIGIGMANAPLPSSMLKAARLDIVVAGKYSDPGGGKEGEKGPSWAEGVEITIEGTAQLALMSEAENFVNISVTFSAEIPCRTQLDVSGTLDAKLGKVTIDGGAVEASYYCDESEDVIFMANFTISSIFIDEFEIYNIKGEYTKYRGNGEDGEHSTKWSEFTIMGSMQLDISSAQVDILVGFAYSNEGGETQIGISVEFNTEFAVNDEMTVSLNGEGNLTVPCKKMGDIAAAVDASFTHKGKGLEWLDGLSASASFATDCQGNFSLSFAIDMENPPTIPIRINPFMPPIDIPLPSSFSLDVVRAGGNFSIDVTMAFAEMFKLELSLRKIEGEDQTGWRIKAIAEDITLQMVVDGVVKLFKKLGVGGDDDGVSFKQAAAELGEAEPHFAHRDKNGKPVDLGNVPHLGGFLDGVKDLGKRILNAPIPYLSLQLDVGTDGTVTVTLVMKDVKIFGVPFQFGAIFAKNGKKAKWKSFLYAGVDMEEAGDVRLDIPESTSAGINKVLSLMRGLSKFGFELSTAKQDLAYVNDISDDFPCEMGLVEKGFALYLEIDLIAATSGPGKQLTDVITSLSENQDGDMDDKEEAEEEEDAEGEGEALDEDAVHCDDYDIEHNGTCVEQILGEDGCKKKSYARNPKSGKCVFKNERVKKFNQIFENAMAKHAEHFVLLVTFDLSEIGIRAAFALDDGFPLTDGVRLMTLGICISVGWSTPSLTLKVEASAEFDVPNGKNPYTGKDEQITLKAFASLEISISLKGITLAALLSASLKGGNQFWYNPFGALPHMGIDFPLTLGFGVKVYPVIAPQYFELEMHLYGCTSKLVDGTRGAALGDAESTAGMLVSRAGRLGGGGEGDPEDMNVTCSPGDLYGSKPTVVSGMINVNMADKLFAFAIKLRQIYFLRLIGMFIKPPRGGYVCLTGREQLPCVLVMMKGIFDLFSVEKFDVSYNSKPWPVQMYSGNEIASGFKVDIVNLNFFKLINIRKALFHLIPDPENFSLEAKVFIDPFAFKIGDVTILEVTGLGRETRAQAFKKQKEAEVARKEAEIEAKRRAEAGDPVTPCGKDKCLTCARGVESDGIETTLTVSCGDFDPDGVVVENNKDGSKTEMVMTRIVDAFWGEAAKQPFFTNLTTPGMCTMPALASGDVINTTGVNVMSPRESLIETIEEACVGGGSNECHVYATRAALGIPPGYRAGKPLALSVVAECMLKANAEKALAAAEAEFYSHKCSEGGCLTCAQVTSSSDTSTDVEIECSEGNLISGILDATYGAADEQPEWPIQEGAGLCNATHKRIPSGGGCQAKRQEVVDALSARCLGRTRCTADVVADVQKEIGGDPCSGHTKRLRVVAECTSIQIPDAMYTSPDVHEFGMLQYEARRLTAQRVPGRFVPDALDAAHTLSINNAFEMRHVFQSSDDIVGSMRPKNFSDFVYGLPEAVARNERGGVVAHRAMAVFALGKDQGAGGHNFWRFKIKGASLLRGKAFLSIVQPTFDRDFCGDDRNGCDLRKLCRAGADECDVDVHLDGSAVYYIFLYAVTSSTAKGDALSLEWKPPTTCFQRVGCEDLSMLDNCVEIPSAKMPWQPVAKGFFTDMRCNDPFSAQVQRMSAQTKPFCMQPESFQGKENECWPHKPAMSGALKDDGACEGFHPLSVGGRSRSTNVMLASTSLDSSSTNEEGDFDVSLDASSGACRVELARTKGHQAMMGDHIGQVGFFGFEEGPCKNKNMASCSPSVKNEYTKGQPAAMYIAKFSDDTAAPTPSSPGGGKWDSVRGAPAPGAQSKYNNRVDEEELGVQNFVTDAHTGKYAVSMGVRKGHGNAEEFAVLRVKLPKLSPEPSVVGKAGTVMMWMRKESATVLYGGEMLFSWTPENAVSSRDESMKADAVAPEMFVMLKPSGALRLESRVAGGRNGFHGTDECWAQSPAVPELLDTAWHHVAISINSAEAQGDAIVATVVFNVDGAMNKQTITCRNVEVAAARARARLGQVNFDDMNKQVSTSKLDAKGGALFYYRDQDVVFKARRELIVGAGVDSRVGTVGRHLHALVDTVGVFDNYVLSSDDIAKFANDFVCVRKGYRGDGYAFFPSVTAATPHELLDFTDALGKCAPGPHVVRLSFARPAGAVNDKILRRLDVAGAAVDLLGSRGTPTEWAFSEPAVVNVVGSTTTYSVQSVEHMNEETRDRALRRLLAAADAVDADEDALKAMIRKEFTRDEADAFMHARRQIMTPWGGDYGHHMSTLPAVHSAAALGKRSGKGTVWVDVEMVLNWMGSMGRNPPRMPKPPPPSPPPPRPPPYPTNPPPVPEEEASDVPAFFRQFDYDGFDPRNFPRECNSGHDSLTNGVSRLQESLLNSDVNCKAEFHGRGHAKYVEADNVINPHVWKNGFWRSDDSSNVRHGRKRVRYSGAAGYAVLTEVGPQYTVTNNAGG